MGAAESEQEMIDSSESEEDDFSDSKLDMPSYYYYYYYDESGIDISNEITNT